MRRIVVTGASRGLGEAMVRGFIELGHVVHGCARSHDAMAAARDRLGPPHTFHPVDVANDEAVGRWAESILREHGPPDLLVNNAALVNGNAPLWEVPAGEFDAVIDVNIKGTANVLRHFLPAMIERGAGAIVNFSSGWGRSTSPEVAPYCATKWAIEGLTRALSQELPNGMAAIPLNPGIIDTDMLQRCFGPQASSYPSPDEWAKRAVPFILGLGPDQNGQPLSVPER